MIVVVDRMPNPQEHRRALEARLGQTIPFFERIEEAHDTLQQAEILVGPAARVTKADLDAAPNLRWCHALSAGVNHLPLDVLRDREILLSNSSGIHRIPMAEHAFAMMLGFVRNLHTNLRNAQASVWSRSVRNIGELANSTLCIVGAGRIAEAAAARAKAFEMHVIGVKRTVQAGQTYAHFDEMVDMDALLDVLPESDWVLLLLPLTPETHHIFGESALAAMKPSAVLVNLARGDVVDEPALIRALHEGSIAGALLDVFATEPLPADSPLWGMDNVILTPHTGGTSHLYYQRAFALFLQNYEAYRRGAPLPTAVDLSLGY